MARQSENRLRDRKFLSATFAQEACRLVLGYKAGGMSGDRATGIVPTPMRSIFASPWLRDSSSCNQVISRNMAF